MTPLILKPMLLRRAPGFVAALFLLPLAILAPAIPGYTMMICRLTGTVVPADCGGTVASDGPDAPTPLHSGWQAGSCCDTLRVSFDHPPAESDAGAPPRAVSFTALRWSAPALPRVERAGQVQAVAPPGLGPPRRLITQTFLI